jgi:hypothetical protein
MSLHHAGSRHLYEGTLTAYMPHETLSVGFSSRSIHAAIKKAITIMTEYLKKYRDLHYPNRQSGRMLPNQ